MSKRGLPLIIQKIAMKRPSLLGRTLARFVVRAAALLAIGTSHAFAETPGEYFRNYIAKRDAECKERQLGPYMPIDEPPLSSRRANHSCHFLFLKPWWETLDEAGKFAHSIKLPPPHDKLTDVYKQGMSPREYFEALCAAQAGEFTFRSTKGVRGIAELRPRPTGAISAPLTRHLTAFEDPATFELWETRMHFHLVNPTRFEFLERVRGFPSQRSVTRYRGYDGAEPHTMRADVGQEIQAQYAYVWRGIRNDRALELGIAGGEALLIDLRTEEVIAFKRDFALRWLGSFPRQQTISVTGFENGEKCGIYLRSVGRPLSFDSKSLFYSTFHITH